MLNELHLARKDSRAVDVATLEEQLNQILREWKAELDEPTPASSLLVCTQFFLISAFTLASFNNE